MDEAGLILAAQRGDLDSFNGLVLHYQEMVFNLAYRMMGEVESAEDATQTAFISAYRNLGAYRGGSFKAWLLRIVSNACYDELRRRKRRPTQPLEPLDTDDQEIESPEWMADPGETPEQRARAYGAQPGYPALLAGFTGRVSHRGAAGRCSRFGLC